MIRLQPIEGPDCPDCGCTDSAEVDRVTWGDREMSVRICGNCGRRWRVGVAELESTTDTTTPTGTQGVAYHVLRCPECGSDATRVTSTRRPLRWHKCDDCDHTFKSFER